MAVVNLGTEVNFAQNFPVSPEQPSCVCLPVRVRGSLQVRLLGHAVLLHGTLQEEKGFVLQIRRGHQLVEIWLKVSLQKSVGAWVETLESPECRCKPLLPGR